MIKIIVHIAFSIFSSRFSTHDEQRSYIQKFYTENTFLSTAPLPVYSLLSAGNSVDWILNYCLMCQRQTTSQERRHSFVEKHVHIACTVTSFRNLSFGSAIELSWGIKLLYASFITISKVKNHTSICHLLFRWTLNCRDESLKNSNSFFTTKCSVKNFCLKV